MKLIDLMVCGFSLVLIIGICYLLDSVITLKSKVKKLESQLRVPTATDSDPPDDTSPRKTMWD